MSTFVYSSASISSSLQKSEVGINPLSALYNGTYVTATLNLKTLWSLGSRRFCPSQGCSQVIWGLLQICNKCSLRKFVCTQTLKTQLLFSKISETKKQMILSLSSSIGLAFLQGIVGKNLKYLRIVQMLLQKKSVTALMPSPM